MSGSRPPAPELAVAFSGGGARGAYQVGVLRALARHHPDLHVDVLTGVSAGAINAVHLASRPGSFAERVEELAGLWSGLEVERVFRVDALSLLGHCARWIAQLGLLGGRRGVPQVGGLVDARPLAGLLEDALASPDGQLPGIAAKLRSGDLDAVAVTATDYGSGETVTFCQGRSIEPWDRPQRRSVVGELRTEHVLASAALPLFFPAIQIGDGWFGDGGVRLHAPLAPAVHLGADRILVLTTSHAPSPAEARAPNLAPAGYPPPAQVLGVLYHSIFLDNLEHDAAQLQRINRLLEGTAPERRGGLRPVELLVLRPSVDLGLLARDCEPDLPRILRFLMRRLGTREIYSYDLVSMILFQSDYAQRLLALGEADAEARADEIAAFLSASR